MSADNWTLIKQKGAKWQVLVGFAENEPTLYSTHTEREDAIKEAISLQTEYGIRGIDPEDSVKVEFNISADFLKYIYQKATGKKITYEQIANALTLMMTEALENASKKTVEELEDMWGMNDGN